MMATITCSGVAPLIAAVTWSKTTGWGAMTGTHHLHPTLLTWSVHSAGQLTGLLERHQIVNATVTTVQLVQA